MKIDVYSNMFNEEIIVPYWLRHYDTIADRIFIWDDDSTDRTKKLLAKNPKVTFLDIGRHGNNDYYWVTQVFPQYEQHSLGQADWVIIADADEFVYHPQLKKVLRQELKRDTQVIHCSGYTMISETLPTTKGQIYKEIKMGLPDRLESKWTVFKAIPGIRFAKGRHGPIYNHSAFCRNRFTGIKLLHYRYLGWDYYSNRDRVVTKQNDMVFHHGKVYSPETFINTMPDGTKGTALEWFAKHKGEAKNVIDEGWDNG